MTTGVDLIREERLRQMDEEGYDATHDKGHADELAAAGAAYAIPPHDRTFKNRRREEPVSRLIPVGWPWDDQYWKPTPRDRVRELVKAGALIAAAIDSLTAEGSAK